MLWLCCAAGMLFWGTLAFPDWISGGVRKVYWGGCLILAAMAVSGATWETWISWRHISKQRELARVRLESRDASSGSPDADTSRPNLP